MPDLLKVGNIVARRGEFKKGYIKGIELNNVAIDVPVLVMNGARDGTTLLLTSTEHGIEIQGAWVIIEVMKKLDPKKLRGAVIGIPVANPTAFMAARYRSWVDHNDVSGSKADDRDGNTTETLAYNLWTEAMSKADAWINMHANTRSDSLLFTIVNTGDPRNKEQTVKMAEAFGYTNIYFDEPPGRIAAAVTPPNSTGTLAAKKGIPSITVEYIEGRWISEPSTSTGVRGALNVMKVFNMIDGKIEPHPEKFPIVRGVNRAIGLIRCRHGGLVRFLKKPGEPIKKGETFAEVYNLHGDRVEEVKMPVDGYVWAYPCGDFDGTSGHMQTVNTGCGLAFGFTHEKD